MSEKRAFLTGAFPSPRPFFEKSLCPQKKTVSPPSFFNSRKYGTLKHFFFLQVSKNVICAKLCTSASVTQLFFGTHLLLRENYLHFHLTKDVTISASKHFSRFSIQIWLLCKQISKWMHLKLCHCAV